MYTTEYKATVMIVILMLFFNKKNTKFLIFVVVKIVTHFQKMILCLKNEQKNTFLTSAWYSYNRWSRPFWLSESAEGFRVRSSPRARIPTPDIDPSGRMVR